MYPRLNIQNGDGKESIADVSDKLSATRLAASPEHQMPTLKLPESNDVEADDDPDSVMNDSDSMLCETNSLSSRLSTRYRGYIENGRRYQSRKEEVYFQPTDETQWAAQEAGHLALLILDCQKENPLFRAPLKEDAKYVLDIGTGRAEWAIDVADKYPKYTVYGIDLFSPPQTWIPPNCILESEDILKPWVWKNDWDLIHMRYMLGSFSDAEWEKLYAEAYEHTAPGGWIEHSESDIGWYTDDDSLPDENPLSHTNYRGMIMECSRRAGRPLDTYDHMRRRIESAGYTNVHEQAYKIPIGTWAKQPIHKDAGRVALIWTITGMEGWVMWLLTSFGQPKLTAEEVEAFSEKMRTELESGHRIYLKLRRVWAQKPLEE